MLNKEKNIHNITQQFHEHLLALKLTKEIKHFQHTIAASLKRQLNLKKT